MSDEKMKDRRKRVRHEKIVTGVTCKPIDCYNELLAFSHNPPSWSSLCIDLEPHSKYLLRNCELVDGIGELDAPPSYCHFDPEVRGNFKLHEEGTLRRTLVCHDVAHGYCDDSIIDGTGSYDVYTFYNWAGIDIFCYFSHHLITIPPLGWINAGHKHGVKVIGTIITERTEGITFWSKVLSSVSEMKQCIDSLVTVAKTLKFDGWLLNVENKVTEAEMLLVFVTNLHTSMHEELKEPLLIWYDSITIDGVLNWQNKLNSKNKHFFDACDGFFTNYSWTVADVEESVLAAGHRLKDLYIGIDVWGRNFYGGGQFNIQQAVKAVHRFGCSIAILGPSWTIDAMLCTNNEEDDGNLIENAGNLSNYQKFLLRDRALWDSIWPFLNTRLPSSLPFVTSFCRGQGKRRRLFGDVICPAPWYNLKHMNYQPNAAHGSHGYRIITKEVLTNVDHRETKGIIKLPDSKEESTTSSPISENREIIVDSKEEPKLNLKEKLKNYFKRKTANLECLTSSHIRHSSSSISVISSGKSMLNMAVNIQLVPQSNTKTRVCLSYLADEIECFEVFHEDSFFGGTCLKINPPRDPLPILTTIRLFYCDFFCKAKVIICVVTKNLAENLDQYLNVYLCAVDQTEREIKVTLVTRYLSLTNAETGEYPCAKSSKKFKDMHTYIMLNHPEFFVPFENFFNWNVFYFEFNLPGARITSINCRTGMPHGSILLGHFGLCDRFK